MGRSKNNSALSAAAAGRSAKDRHQRSARENITVPSHLVPLQEKNIKSKHHSYFQLFENKDKKDKKLEFQTTTDINPPPGFDFVPIGNPELTKTCKELSREQDAMIFIVSATDNAHARRDEDGKRLALQVHRIGHHIRRTIVEQARTQIGQQVNQVASDSWQLPNTQEEINAQAEAAMRDLFPRIPNFDKQMILEHSFRKGTGYGKQKVGTSELPLYRRVQLAVLAHIRHTHTRYDQLLKEADWAVARKVVEKTCLDILVRWRGDEETGRDQIDDMLREVVVISDDSDDEGDSEDTDDDEDGQDSTDDSSVQEIAAADMVGAVDMLQNVNPPHCEPQQAIKKSRFGAKSKARQRRIAKSLGKGPAPHPVASVSKKDRRGFRRYEAVKETVAKRWEEAINRQRLAEDRGASSHATSIKMTPSQTVQRYPSVELITSGHGMELMRADYMRRAPLPAYIERQDHGQQDRPQELPTANLYSGRVQTPITIYSSSDNVPPEGVVISRHVRPPHGNPQAPERRIHDELKDYLVPSVEPHSPHPGPEVPQFVRQVIRGEPSRPEQVPTGQYDLPNRQRTPLENRVRDAESYKARAPVDQRLRQAMISGHERYPVPQGPYDYGYGPRPHSKPRPPPEVSRVHWLRAPFAEARWSHTSETATAAPTRIIRVVREARPADSWEQEPQKAGEPSLHQFQNNTTIPMAYGKPEDQRVVYREVSASRFDEQSRTNIPSSARPPYREVRPGAQRGTWQGSTYIRPHPSASALPPVLRASPDVSLRQPIQDYAPVHNAPADHRFKGQPQHDRKPAVNYSATPSRSSDIEYLYEQSADSIPPRDAMVIR